MTDWSLRELDLIIADYMSMFSKELSGITYSKTEHRRAIVPLLDSRSEGAVEFKYCNISAVLIEMGLPFIKGYKPRIAFQNLLIERCEKYLQIHQTSIEPEILYFIEEPPPVYKISTPNTLTLEDPPLTQEASIRKERKARSPFKINYLEREQRNHSLGLQGEKLAIDFEKQRLIHDGNEKFVDKVEWISQQDDGAGFDILSFDKNGRDRYIEVKSTKVSKEAPIYFSHREYEFSCEKSRQYHLYRIFNMVNKPSMFMLKGNFDSMCRKEATHYRGIF